MAHPTVEASCRLRASRIMRSGGDALKWRACMAWECFHDGNLDLTFDVEKRGDLASVILVHRGRRLTDDGGGRQAYEVKAVSVPMPFGGVRWWWICPRSGRRVADLYLPLGGLQFRSRAAYRLPYAVQRMAPMERARTKLRRQYARIGGDGSNWDQPEKAKWLRWRTYDRKVEELAPLADMVEDGFMRSIARFMAAAR